MLLLLAAKLDLILFLFGDMYGDGRFKKTGEFSLFASGMLYLSVMFIPFAPMLEGYPLIIKWWQVVLFGVIVLIDQIKNKYWDEHGKLRYWYKHIIYACMVGIIYGSTYYIDEFISNSFLYFSILLLKKPLSDIFYSIGYQSKGIYIGHTHILDQFMHWLGLVRLEKTKFPIITALYFFMIFVGLFIGLVGV